MMGSRLGRVFALASFAALSQCTDAGGPRFFTLGVDVEPATTSLGGTEPPPEILMDVCVRVPVLLGSGVEKHERVSGLSVKISATREGATVRFPEADGNSSSREYSLAELRQGVAEDIQVTVDGDAYEAAIASGCTNP
ncbi:MAG TPA: hypothetical protein VFZ53_00480 [Polyangiaceae bacterium]